MIRIIGLYVCLISFLLSCGEETEQVPPDLLPKNKMTAILTDVHIAESALNTNGLTREQIDRAMAIRYQQIMKKDSVTYSQFSNTYDYYLHHPADMDDVYQEVVNRLTALESRTKVKDRKSLNIDSLRLLRKKVPILEK
ncbi:MAG: DUF4296 domain-containing protein [Chitinophagales bacterium]|nr:DUF4296 domain-containing protein [Chitinophagales bacterium]